MLETCHITCVINTMSRHIKNMLLSDTRHKTKKLFGGSAPYQITLTCSIPAPLQFHSKQNTIPLIIPSRTDPVTINRGKDPDSISCLYFQSLTAPSNHHSSFPSQIQRLHPLKMLITEFHPSWLFQVPFHTPLIPSTLQMP